ncbi:HutD family protein [Phenylobacterium sp.]|uniref:HutD/Ves family protein n=1 Tax=Phenylobacterium sp. TaxID=1871053 RepID=UPI00286AD76B|nr:HutD family protein [Phenylobacterium sp.]
MTPHLLRAADRLEQSWKNGGGVTREIACGPVGSGLAAFDWRVSLAEVSAPGPFSTFPGVDRTLSVLEGQLTLGFAVGDPVTLTHRSAPYAFAGDIACHGAPAGGPVVDLNVMVLRGRYRAQVERLEGNLWNPVGDINLLLALGVVEMMAAQRRWDLHRYDAALVAAADLPGVRLFALRGPCITISLRREASQAA